MKTTALAIVGVLTATALGATQAPASTVKRPAAARAGHAPLERPMIVGGAPASPGTFGMMAFVLYQDPATGNGFVCSGTVIAPQLVLTAGHCAQDPGTGVADQPSGYAVATGSLDWTSPARQVSGVARTILNPAYDPATGAGDAALLVLTTATTAPAVPLASDPGDLSLLQPGTPAQIAGWGLTTAGSIPYQLQWGVSAVQSPGYCGGEAAIAGASFDPSRQLCAIDAPTYADATCNGDSGGPLLARRSDGTWAEIGITSSGPASCTTGFPDFFTRADALSSWAAGWIGALAGTSAPAAPVTAPPPQPTPPVASPPIAPAHTTPLAGVYRGRTRQHWPITLRIAPSRTAVSSLSFSFTLTCTRHRPISYSISPGRGHVTWRLKQARGMGFDDTFTDGTGEHYEVKGNFDSSGSAAGFMTTTWRTRRFGTCKSGLVTWGAHAT